MIDGLIFEKNLSWPEVFDIWEANEAGNPGWIRLYRERGFGNWRDWRYSYVKNLQPENLSWCLYQIKNPLASVPNFRGGPFGAWMKYYQGRPSMSFAELAKNKSVRAVQRTRQFIRFFPEKTTLIGLVTRDKKITIIEGTHRCLAMAMIKESGRDFRAEIFIALAPVKLDYLPPFK